MYSVVLGPPIIVVWVEIPKALPSCVISLPALKGRHFQLIQDTDICKVVSVYTDIYEVVVFAQL